jgi:hypothetical protein
VIEEDAFDLLSGVTSLPFPRPERLGKGETWRVAVKVIDPRGNEGLRVLIVSASTRLRWNGFYMSGERFPSSDTAVDLADAKRTLEIRLDEDVKPSESGPPPCTA